MVKDFCFFSDHHLRTEIGDSVASHVVWYHTQKHRIRIHVKIVLINLIFFIKAHRFRD